MEKPDHLVVSNVAFDAMFRALLKTMPAEQFEAFSNYLSELWQDVQIPNQAKDLQPQLTAAKEMCENLVTTSKLERAQ